MKKDFKNIQEEMAYASKNREATFFLNASGEDYIACRCLLLNYFLESGLVLGQQAIEKIMKSTIKFHTTKKITDKHDLIKLKTTFEETTGNSLNRFNDLFRRLNIHYNSRYPDNSEYFTIKSTGELKEIDDLYFFLFDMLEIPEVLKFRTKLFAYLFNKKLVDTLGSDKWLILKNQALKIRLENYKLKNKEAFALTY